MPAPDFSKKTIDTLARRAAFKCSNPDCRKSTVGPNSEDNKSTLIGEAAHIFGARDKSKRYSPDMTDIARADITNALWLCRNCHKLIDTDDVLYKSKTLFLWREEHEKLTLSELGNSASQIQLQEEAAKVENFLEYPPLIRRIIIDRSAGWEYRLTAELMRFLNQPPFRKLEDLRDNLYVRPWVHIENEDALNWVQRCLSDQSNLISPLVNLMPKLTNSWGEIGEHGDVEEIHHVTCLIRDYLNQIVEFEEKLFFTSLPDKYQNILSLLKGAISSQVERIKEIPNHLDNVVALNDSAHEGTRETPLVIEKTITFELPNNWEKQMSKEIKKLAFVQTEAKPEKNNGCLPLIILSFVIWVVWQLF